MGGFQKIVLIIAIVLLIICLVFIGMMMTNSKKSQWPPIVGTCPDYWIDTQGNGRNCVNVQNLGKCTSGTGVTPANLQNSTNSIISMNFDAAQYKGSQGTCNKYKWANSCGITWDGITSGIANPCDKAATK
jgi:hypothetical protein